ncbi:MAG: hypothetical protein HZB51_09045 [Chloroflexi bacterium]|nr:hypothetical protein [Chloroflexota bacterium]
MNMWHYSLLACLLLSSCSSNSPTKPTTTIRPFPTAGKTTEPTAKINPVPTAGVEQQLQELWNRLDKGTPPANKLPISWKPAYSVLFPGEWPPSATTTWVRYAYAQGMDMDLRDGVRVAAPWAKLEFRGNSDNVTIVPLSAKLEPVTIQGVQPIDAATQAILAKGDAVSTFSLQLTALPQPKNPQLVEMRTFYRTWLKYNGAFVNLIRSNHSKFLEWLND